MNTFKEFLIEQQRQEIIDNNNGWGQVPNNTNVDYLGLRVKMKPSTYLELAAELTTDKQAREKIDLIKEHLKQGGTIASPFLDIEVPKSWRKDFYSPKHEEEEEDDIQRQVREIRERAKVVQHDGRHRMNAVQELYGDIPIETHLFFTKEVRNRHITEEWIEKMNSWMENQDGRRLKGPFFEVMQ